MTGNKVKPASEPAAGNLRAYYALGALVVGLVAGMLAGGLADFGGLLVIVALTAVAIGMLRHDGAYHAAGSDA